MRSFLWSRWLKRSLVGSRPHTRGNARRCRPHLEALEDRRLLATFVVTDSGDSGPGTLRQAILASNNSSDPSSNTITFNLPVVGLSTSLPTITVTSPLPVLTAPVTIDGSTQPASILPDGLVVLDGSSARSPNGSPVAGLSILTSATVRGLDIVNFSDAGLEGAFGPGSRVAGNYIGIDAVTGAARPNKDGIVFGGVSGSSSSIISIGGTTAADRNVISGNTFDGISLHGSGVYIDGNFIGTDARGSRQVGNGAFGIALNDATQVSIGAQAPNVISGNQVQGVVLVGGGLNRVIGNLIGTDVSGTLDLGNGLDGIWIIGEDGDAIRGNVIAHNRRDGVLIVPDGPHLSTRDAIQGNQVFDNRSLGIDLSRSLDDDHPNPDGVTPNGPGGVSFPGPNHLRNFPVITTAGASGGSTLITTTLASVPNTTFTIEFFANPNSQDVIITGLVPTYGQGQTILGSATVTTGDDGSVITSTVLPINVFGQLISATATDSDGNTSEFSLDVRVGNLVPTLTRFFQDNTIEGPQTLGVVGTGFSPDSLVLLNGIRLATTLASPIGFESRLYATVPSGLTEEGVPQVVTVVNPGPGGGTSNAMTFTVGDAGLSLATTGLLVTEGIAFTSSLGVLFDAGGPEPADSYTATVDWGDGGKSLAALKLSNSSFGIFQVFASHTYARSGSYTYHVTVSDEGGSMTSNIGNATVVDAPLRGFSKLVNFVAGQPLSRVVGSFLDADPGAFSGLYMATINWGDGAPLSIGPGTVTANGSGFDVTGTHIYANARATAYPVTVTVRDQDGATQTISSGALVAEPPLQAQERDFVVVKGTAFSGAVATFTDPDPRTDPTKYTATITWDDGTSSAGKVTSTNPFTVKPLTAHTFAAFGGTHTISVTISDAPGGQGRFVTVYDRIVDPSSQSPNAPFVYQLYQDLLGRTADDDGLAYWSTALDQGASRAQVVAGIVASLEYRSREVQSMYRTYLHRDADPSGLSAFTGLLAGGGTIEQTEALIASSPEYYQVRGGGTNDGFLIALYQDGLGRAIDATGRVAWGDALRQGVTRGRVADLIFASEEYREDLVNGFYQRFFERDAESAGLVYWSRALQQGARREDILGEIVGSDEYLQRVL